MMEKLFPRFAIVRYCKSIPEAYSLHGTCIYKYLKAKKMLMRPSSTSVTHAIQITRVRSWPRCEPEPLIRFLGAGQCQPMTENEDEFTSLAKEIDIDFWR